MSTRYVYDAASNRTNKTVFGGPNPGSINSVYNNLNQLVSATNSITGKSSTFEYDANGNRIKQTRSDGQVTDYVYDPSNRLISVSDAGKVKTIDINGPNGLKTQAHFTVDSTYGYTYDYRTRRIARDENGQKTDIVFLGGTSVMEFEGAGNGAAPNRAAGTVPTVEYIRGSDLGGGIGGILYSLRPDDNQIPQPSFTWYNNRGDVVAKTGSDGTLTYQAAYEAFGSRTQEEGETEDRQRANTREETAWGGLYENMRWRDLETGTYLTRDPAGFVDGPNLYAYVRQNPWTKFDPHGLSESWPWLPRSAKDLALSLVFSPATHIAYDIAVASWLDPGRKAVEQIGISEYEESILHTDGVIDDVEMVARMYRNFGVAGSNAAEAAINMPLTSANLRDPSASVFASKIFRRNPKPQIIPGNLPAKRRRTKAITGTHTYTVVDQEKATKFADGLYEYFQRHSAGSIKFVDETPSGRPGEFVPESGDILIDSNIGRNRIQREEAFGTATEELIHFKQFHERNLLYKRSKYITDELIMNLENEIEPIMTRNGFKSYEYIE